MSKQIATLPPSTRRNGQRREERWGREHDTRNADAPRMRDRAVEKAGERTQPEKGQAPQSHDSAALVLGHS